MIDIAEQWQVFISECFDVMLMFLISRQYISLADFHDRIISIWSTFLDTLMLELRKFIW